MRKLYAMLLAFTLVLTACTGGASTWWESFKNDPAMQAEVLLGQVATIEHVATLAFAQVKGFLPADQQEKYQAKFDQAIIAVAKAGQALRTAVAAAAEAKEDRPDLAAVIAGVGKAVRELQGVIAEVKNLIKPGTVGASAAGGKAVDTSGAETLDGLVSTLNAP